MSNRMPACCPSSFWLFTTQRQPDCMFVISNSTFWMRWFLVPVCHVPRIGRIPCVRWCLGAKQFSCSLIFTHVFLCTDLISNYPCSLISNSHGFHRQWNGRMEAKSWLPSAVGGETGNKASTGMWRIHFSALLNSSKNCGIGNFVHQNIISHGNFEGIDELMCNSFKRWHLCWTHFLCWFKCVQPPE